MRYKNFLAGTVFGIVLATASVVGANQFMTYSNIKINVDSVGKSLKPGEYVIGFDNQLYLPARFAEELGYWYGYDYKSRTITLNKKSPLTPPQSVQQPAINSEELIEMSGQNVVPNGLGVTIYANVKNISTQSVFINEVTVTFFDKNQNVVGSASNNYYGKQLIPGQSYPISVFSSMPPKEATNYHINVGYSFK